MNCLWFTSWLLESMAALFEEHYTVASLWFDSVPIMTPYHCNTELQSTERSSCMTHVWQSQMFHNINLIRPMDTAKLHYSMGNGYPNVHQMSDSTSTHRQMTRKAGGVAVRLA